MVTAWCIYSTLALICYVALTKIGIEIAGSMSCYYYQKRRVDMWGLISEPQVTSVLDGPLYVSHHFSYPFTKPLCVILLPTQYSDTRISALVPQKTKSIICFTILGSMWPDEIITYISRVHLSMQLLEFNAEIRWMCSGSFHSLFGKNYIKIQKQTFAEVHQTANFTN